MSRYIDADKLIKEFGSLEQLARKRVYDTPTNSPAYERYSTQYCEREKALSIIKAQPTADVVEVRHGTWHHGRQNGVAYAECSACRRKMDTSCYGYAYCSLCGARMDGERSENGKGTDS